MEIVVLGLYLIRLTLSALVSRLVEVRINECLVRFEATLKPVAYMPFIIFVTFCLSNTLDFLIRNRIGKCLNK